MASQDDNGNTNTLFFVGCYTQIEGHVPDGRGEGIYSFLLNHETGELTNKHIVVAKTNVTNPTYLLYNNKENELYAVEEIGEINQSATNLISYTVDHTSNNTTTVPSVTENFKVDLQASALCHLCYYNNKYILSPAYASGDIHCVVTKKDSTATKKIGRCSSYYKYTGGKGPHQNKERQESPHPHQIYVSPDEKYFYVCDLGSDKIWCHLTSSLQDIDETNKQDETATKSAVSLQDPILSISTPAGYGPRHLVFHPTLPNVYVLCELSGMLLSYQYDATTGKLIYINEIYTLPKNYSGEPTFIGSAAIRIHSNIVYISNRGIDQIVCFPVDPMTGKLKEDELSYISCGGKTPRDFCIDPITGKWLLVANQDDHTIVVFEVMSKEIETNATKILTNPKTYTVHSPSCIAFPSRV